MSGHSPANTASAAEHAGGMALRFSLGGVPVRIDPSFLIVATLLGLDYGATPQLLAWVAVVVFAVLLHEMGHAVAFRAFGQRPHIRLTSMVGLTSGSGPVTRLQDVVTRLAGPVAGLVPGVLIVVFLDFDTITSVFWRNALADLIFALIAWSLLNLLPILPLDGGGIMAALLGGGQDPSRQRIAHIISAVVAGVAALGAFATELVFVGLLAAFFCYSNVSAVTSGRRRQVLLAANDALANGDVDRAAALLAGLAPRHDELPLRAGVAVAAHQAGPLLDQVCRWHGLGDGAADIASFGAIGQLASGLAHDGGAAHIVAGQMLLHAEGHFGAAVELSEVAWRAGVVHPVLAYNAACSCARAGAREAGLRWLWKAHEVGLRDATVLDREPELATVRALPAYEDLHQAMTAA